MAFRGAIEEDVSYRELGRVMQALAPEEQIRELEEFLAAKAGPHERTSLSIYLRCRFFAEHHSDRWKRFFTGFEHQGILHRTTSLMIARSQNEKLAMRNISECWPSWDWIVPGQRSPPFWTENMLSRLYTLARRSPSLERAMQLLREQVRNRLISRKGKRGVPKTPHVETCDINAAIEQLPAPISKKKKKTTARRACPAPLSNVPEEAEEDGEHEGEQEQGAAPKVAPAAVQGLFEAPEDERSIENGRGQPMASTYDVDDTMSLLATAVDVSGPRPPAVDEEALPAAPPPRRHVGPRSLPSYATSLLQVLQAAETDARRALEECTDPDEELEFRSVYHAAKAARADFEQWRNSHDI